MYKFFKNAGLNNPLRGSSKASFTEFSDLYYMPDTRKPKLNLIHYNVGQHWSKMSNNMAAFYVNQTNMGHKQKAKCGCLERVMLIFILV